MADAFQNTAVNAWINTAVNSWFGVGAGPGSANVEYVCVLEFDPIGPVTLSASVSEKIYIREYMPYAQVDQPSNVIAQTVYICTLTGNPDIRLPVASIQMNRRNGSPSYMAVVVPSVEQLETANERIGEQLILERGYRFPNGVEMLEEISRANLRDVRTEEGPVERKMTLVGYKQTTYPVGKRGWEIGIESYTISETGKRTVKSVVTDNWINPGDVIDLYGDPVTIGEIRYAISDSVETMQIMEA